MLTNGVPGGGNQPPKGKAVEIHHHLFDALWNIGTRQIDASILIRQATDDNSDKGHDSQDDEERKESVEESKTDQPVEESKDEATTGQAVIEDENAPARNLPLEGDVDANEELEESKEAAASVQEESKDIAIEEEKVSVEDMDVRVIEAFHRSLLESVQDKDLPMEPSDYMKKHFAEYSCTEFRLDLRLSSFKKIGKLLEQAARDGTIDYEMAKLKDHKVITKVNRDNPR